MIILIPLGGIGDRFKKNGYTEPKPLINVIGRRIIEWLLDNLDMSKVDRVLIPYNRELDKYRFEDLIRKSYPNVSFIFHKLDSETGGAVETILHSLNVLELIQHPDCPILSLDGDNFYLENVIEMWKGQNALFVFEDDSVEECYSYVTIEKGGVSNIAEKRKISNYACTGGYGFQSWKTFKKYCEYVIDNNIRNRNEFYVSTTIDQMIRDDIKFTPILIDRIKYICLGTPLHVRIFCNNILKYQFVKENIIKHRRICFDLDNTLVTYPKVNGDYTTVEPINKNIEFLRICKSQGHTIIINTARRMHTHHGNVGKVVADIGRITLNTLEKLNIPYDEIYFGKPHAHFYIDDLAISASEDIEKKIGIYKNDISPRSFNFVTNSIMHLVKKISDNLSAEINYYRNIPDDLIDIFPIMVRFDSIDKKWYEMEKIDGIPLSHIHLSEQINRDILMDVIRIFDRLHSHNIPPQDVDIYTNYSTKVRKRNSEHDFTQYDTDQTYYERLVQELDMYEKEMRGKQCMIHGDAVMTNIMIDKMRKIRLIDMRGKLGDQLTVCGDVMYDWAKFYQSLVGYDEILESKPVHSNYKMELINAFEKIFVEKFGENRLRDLSLITSSLLYSLIPLHNDDKCKQYYNLGKKIFFDRFS